MTQDDVAKAVGASLRSVAAWERDEAKPQAAWAAKLDSLFSGQFEVEEVVVAAEPGEDPALSDASDLELLAELARRLASANRSSTNQPSVATSTDALRVRWAASDLPSAKRAKDAGAHPDSKDQRA